MALTVKHAQSDVVVVDSLSKVPKGTHIGNIEKISSQFLAQYVLLLYLSYKKKTKSMLIEVYKLMNK